MFKKSVVDVKSICWTDGGLIGESGGCGLVERRDLPSLFFETRQLRAKIVHLSRPSFNLIKGLRLMLINNINGPIKMKVK